MSESIGDGVSLSESFLISRPTTLRWAKAQDWRVNKSAPGFVLPKRFDGRNRKGGSELVGGEGKRGHRKWSKGA